MLAESIEDSPKMVEVCFCVLAEYNDVVQVHNTHFPNRSSKALFMSIAKVDGVFIIPKLMTRHSNNP